MFTPFPRHAAACVAATLLSVAASPGGDVAFKTLDDQRSSGARSRESTHVSFFGGTTQNQSGDVQIMGIPYDLADKAGQAHIGIRIGHEWRGRRWPIATALEFEGSFLSSELNGTVDPGSLASLTNDSITSFHSDMNAAMFFLNGKISLDLRRHRARVGTFLSKLRPYAGAGVGGAQFWFRNTTYTTLDGVSLPNATPFATDQFVFGWQAFGGFEYRVSHKVHLFGEYKFIHFDSFEETNELEHSSWVAGVKINYDKKKKADEE